MNDHLISMLLIYSTLAPLLEAQADVGERDLRPYIRLQTGFQSSSLNSPPEFSPSWDLDLSVGLLSHYFALELNGGASLSVQGYQRSNQLKVESYSSIRTEGIIYYHLGLSPQVSILLGGGIGWRAFNQNLINQYQEGTVLQITSSLETQLTEETLSTLVRLACLFGEHGVISIDYDRFSLTNDRSYIETLGFNIGLLY